MERVDNIVDYQNMMKESYIRYLTQIRKNSDSTVRHYLDALNNISRRLLSKKLIRKDIFEVVDLAQLHDLKIILENDEDYVALNARGHQMYSAALNNYCKFAEGNEFKHINVDSNVFDFPRKPEKSIVQNKVVWQRSTILRKQALELADYKCEINAGHETFVADNTHKIYMEGHHALPMQLQDKFDVSLDVLSNIVCLCPICHRKVHFGLQEDRHDMYQKIYSDRCNRMKKSGLSMSFYEFENLLDSTENYFRR